MRAGPRSPSKRMKRTSAKIFSKSYWNYFLVTMRFTHVPFGCGVWPAFWTHAPRSVWPNGGELDILEWANDFPGQVSFHTGERNKCRLHHQAMNPPGCTPMPDTNGMNYDCDTHYPSKPGASNGEAERIGHSGLPRAATILMRIPPDIRMVSRWRWLPLLSLGACFMQIPSAARKNVRGGLRHGKLGPDAPVLVFWDLDNLKPSPSVSLRSCILALGMRMNSTNTKVHIFANTHTWSRLYVAKADGSSPESGEAVDWPEGNLSQIHPDALFGPGSLLCAMRSRTGRRPEPSDLSLSGWAQSAGLLLQERGAEAVLFHLRRFLALHAATFTAVPSTFQAADRALSQSLRREVEAHRRSRGTVVVVSGDADFAHGLDFARRQGWRTARFERFAANKLLAQEK
ncbi:unnamed protein product [Effrenium voratum]|uniref:NYN domain-containing protein n=1 Tax=Effrenium voratum TaxID=2562239 RepID=A0AA36II55_9DINO|nr:unnamed protein product [Effrenium voratum]